MKILTDKNGQRLEKGTIVHYKTGWMEVRSAFGGKGTVNLGPIFHSKTTIKGVPVSEVYADHDAWHTSWTQSESYKSM